LSATCGRTIFDSAADDRVEERRRHLFMVGVVVEVRLKRRGYGLCSASNLPLQNVMHLIFSLYFPKKQPSFCFLFFLNNAMTHGSVSLGQRHVPLAPKRHRSAARIIHTTPTPRYRTP